MRPILVDNDSSSIGHLIALVRKNLAEPKVIHYSRLSDSDIDSDSPVILSGSHTLTAAWHDDIFQSQLQLIKGHRGPLVGICFGMQLIAHAYGAHLHRLADHNYGIAPIKITADDVIFNDIYYPKVFESHTWAVRKLPPHLTSLAESGTGIEVLKHDRRFIYGLQFHPEASDDIDGKRIFKNITALMK